VELTNQTKEDRKSCPQLRPCLEEFGGEYLLRTQLLPLLRTLATPCSYEYPNSRKCLEQPGKEIGSLTLPPVEVKNQLVSKKNEERKGPLLE